MNQDDVHPVVGPSEVEGLYLAYGESGHGFKLAPAIGSLLAQQVRTPRMCTARAWSSATFSRRSPCPPRRPHSHHIYRYLYPRVDHEP